MPLVLEHEVVDVLAAGAQALDEIRRLLLDDARVVLALDHEQRAGDVLDVRARRALDEEVALGRRVAEREREERLPRLGDALAERDEVVRAEHVAGCAPQLGVARGEHERHVAAVGASDDAGARDVDALVVRQDFLHRVHVVEPVLAAPVAVDALRVCEAVAGRAAAFGTKTAKPSSVRIWISGIENHAKSGRSWPCGPPWMK